MTKEEAIARLQADLGWHHSDGNRKAHEMGIQALERTKWIPCSERLPEGLVICCDKEGNMLLGYLRRSATGYIAHDYAGTELYGCVAWLPLPDAYCKENEKMKYSERLKPCPFCGGKGEIYQAPTMLNLKIDDDVYWVQCRNCFGRTGNSYSKIEAINAWNRRMDNGKTD